MVPIVQELGNVFVAAARDVYFSAKTIGAGLNNYFNFQYIMLNGPNSIFTG